MDPIFLLNYAKPHFLHHLNMFEPTVVEPTFGTRSSQGSRREDHAHLVLPEGNRTCRSLGAVSSTGFEPCLGNLEVCEAKMIQSRYKNIQELIRVFPGGGPKRGRSWHTLAGLHWACCEACRLLIELFSYHCRETSIACPTFVERAGWCAVMCSANYRP